jgi:SAM domain (Sterile alpha motif)
MDVGGWLRGLGLSQYEEKFRDDKIDADVLPQLTADDLRDIWRFSSARFPPVATFRRRLDQCLLR